MPSRSAKFLPHIRSFGYLKDSSVSLPAACPQMMSSALMCISNQQASIIPLRRPW